jgi:hypothetical protein
MKWPAVYLHVTLSFVLVHNKPINMSVKRNLYFDIQPPATSSGFLASYHQTVYEYKQHKLTTPFDIHVSVDHDIMYEIDKHNATV